LSLRGDCHGTFSASQQAQAISNKKADRGRAPKKPIEASFMQGSLKMRVIAGVAKGRKLYTPKGISVRPTSDRVKEAMFNIIGPKVIDTKVLDVFAGTGNLGIEALSRGASEAIFIDSKAEAIELIKKNLEITGLKSKAVVIRADVEKGLKNLIKDKQKFNLIFLDPPYGISVSFLNAILFMLSSYLLDADGLLVLERPAKANPITVEGLEIESIRIYGDTALMFYRKKGHE